MQNERLVWYVAYGSNVNWARFKTYIYGGPIPGTEALQRGCKDHTPPRDDRAVDLANYGLYFSGTSANYPAATAYLSLQPGIMATKARAYLISLEQFWDIFAQENHWQDDAVPCTIEELRAKGNVLIRDEGTSDKTAKSQYMRVIYCGDLDGTPMVSLGATDLSRPFGKPSAVYLQTIAAGLLESRKLTHKDIANYFVSLPGIAGNIAYNELLDIITAIPPALQ